MKNFKKLRYGGVAIALTALIIAVIVLFNVVFTSLAMSNAWYIDMTPNSIYSLSDECLSVIKTGVAKYNEQRKAAGEDEDVYLPAWTVQTVTGKSTAFEDPTMWTNESMATYFGVKSVRVGEAPAEEAAFAE